MSHRKTSMTMADLEAIHENRATAMSVPTVHVPVDVNVEIFEEICQEAEHDDLSLLENRLKHLRRISSSIMDDHALDTAVNDNDEGQAQDPTTLQYHRRHSSYEPAMRRKHREDHKQFKEYFQSMQDTHAFRRSSIVNNLLQFNLSVDVSMNSFSDMSRSAAVHLSCPVLSYMNDDEEDSVELRHLKRPSMTYVGEDSLDQSWESLKDDSSTSNENETSVVLRDAHEESREYIIQLPPMEDMEGPPRPRRRKNHSYKILGEKLSETSHLQVLKSFQPSFIKAAAVSAVSTTSSSSSPPRTPTTSNKSLEHDHEMTRSVSQGPVSTTTRPATARGA